MVVYLTVKTKIETGVRDTHRLSAFVGKVGYGEAIDAHKDIEGRMADFDKTSMIGPSMQDSLIHTYDRLFV